MATIYYGVKNTGRQDMVVEVSINDNDTPRILAWLMSSNSGYGIVRENILHSELDMDWEPNEGQEEKDRPIKQWQEWNSRPATASEAATAYARSTLAALLSSTIAWEKDQKAMEAANSVKPIEVTSE